MQLWPDDHDERDREIENDEDTATFMAGMFFICLLLFAILIVLAIIDSGAPF